MPVASRILEAMHVLELSADGPLLDSDRAFMDCISNALSAGATMVTIPIRRFPPEFFQLRTRFAGDMLQKFVNYRLLLAIVGDLSESQQQSKALSDFIRESNRGQQIWFVSNTAELMEKLASTRR